MSEEVVQEAAKIVKEEASLENSVNICEGENNVLEMDMEENIEEKRGEKRKTCVIEECSQQEKKESAPRDDVQTRNEEAKQTDEVQNITEKDVGITEYISKYKGCTGVIKQRISDFMVNEISQEGKMLQLTDLSVPVEMRMQQSRPENLKPDFTVLPEETWTKLSQLAESREVGKSVEIEVTELSKEERKKIHLAIKMHFPHMNSNTKEKDGKKLITVDNSANERDKWKIRRSWPKDRGNYLHFVLYKENLDTMVALNQLASKIHVKPNMFSFAGTKDRRAKTTQLVSLYRVEAERLAEASTKVKLIRVGNFAYKPSSIHLGDLEGNHFKIVIRNITDTENQVEQAMSSLRDQGFINYFGMQRFGTTAVPTHHIGRAILQGNMKEAVDLILKPRPEEKNQNLTKVRDFWWKTRNHEKALKMLIGRDEHVEGKLLLGLIKNKKNDYVAALEKVPRNYRLMYIHAYQSRVWNLIVSRRIQKYGLRPIVGDLVLKDVKLTGEDIEELESVESETSFAPKMKPLVLQEKELPDVSIEDIVLPLPGYEVCYPENEIQQWYEELLAEDGLSSASLKHKIKKYSLAGKYRRIIVRPNDVSWKLMKYQDHRKNLLLSDMDQMNGVETPTSDEDGYHALVLEFTLPSSVYATMALREVMKCDTSPNYQASLNNYFQDPPRKKMKNVIGGATAKETENKEGKFGDSISSVKLSDESCMGQKSNTTSSS